MAGAGAGLGLRRASETDEGLSAARGKPGLARSRGAAWSDLGFSETALATMWIQGACAWSRPVTWLLCDPGKMRARSASICPPRK